MTRKLRVCGIRFLILGSWCLFFCVLSYAQDIKEPNVAGSFYPDNPKELSLMIDTFLDVAKPPSLKGNIFALISPHAGYPFSGGTAAFGYKLVKDKPYKTIIVIGPSHYYGFSGVSVYAEGVFRTPLGSLEIDKEFAQKLLFKDKDVFFDPASFQKEHSVEVQLPFLQKVLSNFRIVPIVMGDCSFSTCEKLAGLLKQAIGDRQDVLVVSSTDMYHGYDYEELQIIDKLTLSYLENMDAQGLYESLRDAKLQLCGGLPVVTTIILSKELGHNKLISLWHTSSAEVTGKKIKGIWTVGYTSCVIPSRPQNRAFQGADKLWPLEYFARRASSETSGFSPRSFIDQETGEAAMLNKEQRKKLLLIARNSISTYLKLGKKPELSETDPLLLKEMGAFVTLHESGQLRGCIGNLVGQNPLYLTIRDMAIEAAVDDPRFSALTLKELAGVEIEISALSPLKRIDSSDEIIMGTHGVLVRRGVNSGVFLPQVARETGWSKEEFLSQLCSQKAGLSPLAWKDKSTEIYTFTAEVFSEKSY